jgi:hypothetical protein
VKACIGIPPAELLTEHAGRTQALSERDSEAVGFLVDICLCRKSLLTRPVRHNELSDGDDTGNRFGTRDDPGQLTYRPVAAGQRACDGARWNQTYPELKQRKLTQHTPSRLDFTGEMGRHRRPVKKKPKESLWMT